MLYLIGLGLNEKGISLEGKEAIKKCHKVYLERYTVDFPYDTNKLFNSIDKNSFMEYDRTDVESDKLISQAKKENVALLVYGSPLFATTHISLLIEARKQRVGCRVIYSASVFDALGETGLQLYKFGKITSMPAWKKNFAPDSFIDVVKENQSIKAHSLILVDIGMGIIDALHELKVSAKNKGVKLDKVIICSKLGTNEQKIYYDSLDNLKIMVKNDEEHEIELPFCIIIAGEMHFLEKEALENAIR